MALIILPGTAVLLIPSVLMHHFSDYKLSSLTDWDHSFLWPAGGVIVLFGLYFFLAALIHFFRQKEGTIAPWDPTQTLISKGIYQRMRNPMIFGVSLILAGLSLIINSLAVAVWTLLFVLINQIYFVYVEEPGLERRFGEPYREYKNKVPRWWRFRF